MGKVRRKSCRGCNRYGAGNGGVVCFWHDVVLHDVSNAICGGIVRVRFAVFAWGRHQDRGGVRGGETVAQGGESGDAKTGHMRDEGACAPFRLLRHVKWEETACASLPAFLESKRSVCGGKGVSIPVSAREFLRSAADRTFRVQKRSFRRTGGRMRALFWCGKRLCRGETGLTDLQQCIIINRILQNGDGFPYV